MKTARYFLRDLGVCVTTAAFLLGFAGGCETDEATGLSTTWAEAFDATDAGWLLSTWATPDGTVRYAAGGALDAGSLWSDGGGSWAPVDVAADVGSFGLLNWIHGFSADDITVVGQGGVILHWDGAAWAVQPTPTDQMLWGVWGASPDDLWAVGGDTNPDGSAVILRYDGSDWTEMAVPDLEIPAFRAFFKVWGTATDHLLIVGQKGVVLRWDGTQLIKEEVGAADDLIALWGTGRDHIAIVGGRGNGVLSTWDGSVWRTESLAPLPGLNGVWMRKHGVIHAVGALSTIVTIDFDTFAVTDAKVETPDDFHAIHGDATGRITTVGGSFRLPIAPFTGMAWQRGLSNGE